MLLRYVLLGFGVVFFLMLSESNSKAQTSYNSSSPPTGVTGTITAAIQTASGNYLTAVGGGGLSSSNFGSTGVAVQTDAMTAGPSETLTVVWLNTSYTKFALRTLTGNYVTAVNGGGIGGPNDGSSPIHTDATSISGWETFRINFLPNNQVTINLPDGRFLTAVNGGGVSGTSTSPISDQRIANWPNGDLHTGEFRHVDVAKGPVIPCYDRDKYCTIATHYSATEQYSRFSTATDCDTTGNTIAAAATSCHAHTGRSRWSGRHSPSYILDSIDNFCLSIC